MTDLEIISYINSKDVRTLLLEKKYKFSSAEAAWIVYNKNGISNKRKFDAWHSIMATMPDQTIDIYGSHLNSFHSALLQYMSIQKADSFFSIGDKPLLLDEFFWSDIPLPSPFKKGDIVYNPNAENPLETVAVVDDISFSEEELSTENTYYGGDLRGYGLFTENKRTRLCAYILGNSSYFEYYPTESLSGGSLIYKFLSDYLKNRIRLNNFLYHYECILHGEAND